MVFVKVVIPDGSNFFLSNTILLLKSLYWTNTNCCLFGVGTTLMSSLKFKPCGSSVIRVASYTFASAVMGEVSLLKLWVTPNPATVNASWTAVEPSPTKEPVDPKPTLVVEIPRRFADSLMAYTVDWSERTNVPIPSDTSIEVPPPFEYVSLSPVSKEWLGIKIVLIGMILLV